MRIREAVVPGQTLATPRMMPSLTAAGRLRHTRVIEVALIVAVAAALGVAVPSLAGPTAVLCGVLTIACLTWYSPRGAARAALLMLFVTPFLTVIPFLNPDQVNYGALYTIAVLPVAGVVCANARRFVFDSGALLLTAILVSSLVTLLIGGTLIADYSYLIWPLTTLAVYLLVLNSSQDCHARLLLLIVSFAVIEALIGISQSFLHWPLFKLSGTGPALLETDRGLLGFVLPGFSRMVVNASGTFWHFNVLGSLLALSLPICFGWLLDDVRSFRRLLPFLILASGLATTYSRGAWIGGLVGCILVYWASRPKTSRSWLPLVVSGALLMTALFAPYLAAYYGATQNVTSRVATWQYAFAYWLRHIESIPFGEGFGSFGQRILGQGALQRGMLPSLHSGLLEIVLEMGIVGLLLFGWFLVTTFRFPLRGGRSGGWQAWALGGILGLLVSQLFDNALFYMTGTCAFALAACLRRADARSGKQHRMPWTERSRPASGTLHGAD